MNANDVREENWDEDNIGMYMDFEVKQVAPYEVMLFSVRTSDTTGR